MFTFIAIVFAVGAYLIGSINTSVLLSKHFYGEDVRDSGSGNAGATNMLRNYGVGIAVLTLVCDILKGVIPVILVALIDPLIADNFSDSSVFVGNLRCIVALCIVLGHVFPVWFGFRGGKGVATSLGVILALNWQIGLIILVIALLIMAFSRYVSLGSVTAALVYPFIVITYTLASGEKLSDNIVYLAMAFALALLVIAKHHANIKRLRNGTENKLFSKKKKSEEEKK